MSASENNKRLPQYLLSGGVAFVSEYSVFLLLFYGLRVNEVIANALGFMIGLSVSFVLNKFWVFNGQHDKNLKRQFVLYTALALTNLTLTSLAIYVLIGAGMAAFFAKFILMVIVAVWNFLIFRYYIFSRKTI